MDKASPASDQRITIDIAAGVAEVTLNRPDKLNALDPAMFKAIIAAGERLSSAPGLRAVVLDRRGPRLLRRPRQGNLRRDCGRRRRADFRRAREAHSRARQ